MICNRCGVALNDGVVFCHNCGAKAEAADSSVQNYLKPPQTRPEPKSEPQFQPQPVQQYIYNNSYTQEKKHLSVGGWVLRYLINFIPAVGPIIFIIMLFVWASDEKYDDTSRNWAKASLVFMGIAVALLIIAGIISVITGEDILEEIIVGINEITDALK